MQMQIETQGKGQPLVLVPGGLTGWLGWEPHVPRLSRNRTVARVQLLNVQLGLESTPLPPGYSVKMESNALESTLSAAGLPRPFDMAAWSYGALVTLDFALDHPEAVRTLTLIEPPAFWVLSDPDSEAKAQMDKLRSLTGEISEDGLEGFAHVASLAPPGTDVRALPQWPTWVRHRSSLRNSPAVIEHVDDRTRLRSFAQPVLLVKGTGSTRFLHQIIDCLAVELPGSEVAEWPAGHAPHIVSMDAFLEKLEGFLSTPSTIR